MESFKPEVGFEIQFDVSHNDKIYQHLWKVTDVVPVRKNATVGNTAAIPAIRS